MQLDDDIKVGVENKYENNYDNKNQDSSFKLNSKNNIDKKAKALKGLKGSIYAPMYTDLRGFKIIDANFDKLSVKFPWSIKF